MANYNIVTGGELQHRDHKYIKKYQVNGKWRYVYANEAQHKSIHNNLREAEHDRRGAETFKQHFHELDTDIKNGNNSVGYRNARKYAADNAAGYSEVAKRYTRTAEKTIKRHELKTLTAARAKADKVASKVKSFISKITKR